jgi:hypothetical protein
MFFFVEPFDISCLHCKVILLVSMAGMSVCYAILGNKLYKLPEEIC